MIESRSRCEGEGVLRANLGIVLAAFLTACAVTPPLEAQADDPPSCDASRVQNLVGSEVASETGAILLERTGARQIRWAPPRTAMTMDFRLDRLTVFYDDHMVIERISCG